MKEEFSFGGFGDAWGMGYVGVVSDKLSSAARVAYARNRSKTFEAFDLQWSVGQGLVGLTPRQTMHQFFGKNTSKIPYPYAPCMEYLPYPYAPCRIFKKNYLGVLVESQPKPPINHQFAALGTHLKNFPPSVFCPTFGLQQHGLGWCLAGGDLDS